MMSQGNCHPADRDLHTVQQVSDGAILVVTRSNRPRRDKTRCWRAACLLVGLTIGAAGCQQSDGNSVPGASGTKASSETTQPVASDTAAPQAVSPGIELTGERVEADSPLQAIDQPPSPLLEDWTKPALAILLSGEQHGYLEPCGCSERQSGGLARRTDLVHQLEARGWTVTGFDLGGTLKRSRRQSEMKFEFTRDALDMMGYKGLGLGAEELKLGVLKLFEEHSRTASEASFDVPFVSANVTFFGTRELGSPGGTPLEYRLVDVGGVKIAVTSVLGKTFQEEMFPAGAEPDPNELRIDPVDEVLPAVIEQMQAEQPDLMLLLSYARRPESAKIAETYPVFDLVVTAGSPEDPVGKIETVGQSLFLKVGTKGKNVGIVGYYPGADPEFRFDVVELDRFRFGSAAEIDRRMAEYQELLREENLIANEPTISHEFGAGYEYVGSEKCADCHTEEYEIWKGTPHAMHAYDSLTVAYAQASDDPSMAMRVRVDRIHDPECINCHTTGWDAQEVLRFEGGFTGIETTPHLAGVGCEACHGPASKHVDLEENSSDEDALLAERRKLHLSTGIARTKLCVQCHDFENSPDFDFNTYWHERGVEH